MLKLSNSITIATLVFFLCIHLEFNSLWAQSSVQDPYKKPALWAKLEENPLDENLWFTYLGEPWANLSTQKKIKVKLWMQELWRKKVSREGTSAIIPNKETLAQINKVEKKSAISGDDIKMNNEEIKSEISTYKEILKKPTVINYFSQLEDVVMSEPAEMVELKDNLFENFIILEEYYRESYAEYGIDYVPYHQKYPEGNYSELMWVSEQDKRLKELRQLRLNTMKLEFLKGQVSSSSGSN